MISTSCYLDVLEYINNVCAENPNKTVFGVGFYFGGMLLARAHGDLKQWREAAAAAALAPPLEQYWLGTRLAESGHLTDARHLLGAACDDLDSETRARCSQLLLRLGGPL